ncbi:HIT family protein [Candidatus Woesearchaeota archaeon]|nr:HIT family protein [Candidatus Woesearchaeota archaeon]
MADYKSEDDQGNCIFCKIASGEIKPRGNGIIFENNNYLAWLSPFPNTKGFSVVIPKKHFDSDVLKMPKEDLNEFISVSKKVASILENYFDDVGRVGLIMEGTGVNHAHIKLFPMHGTEYMKRGEWKQFHSNNDSYFEKYEGFISSNDGPQADFNKIEDLAEKIRKINS